MAQSIEANNHIVFGSAVSRICGELKRRKLFVQVGDHRECNPNVCKPMTEQSLQLNNPQTNNVYVCQYGRAHVCSEKSCEHYRHVPNMTCPVSGIQYGTEVSSFSRADARTWKTKPSASTSNTTVTTTAPRKIKKRPGRKRKVPPTATDVAPPVRTKRRVADADARIIAEQYIRLLLFSQKRAECNENVKRKCQQDAVEACAGYRKNNKGTIPFAIQEYGIFCHYANAKAPPFQILDVDQYKDRYNYYIDIILHVWNLVEKYYRDYIKCYRVCIGVLYMMQDGYGYSETQVLIPQDPFLARHLPTNEYLEHFGIHKQSLTRGDTVIRKTFDLAKQAGATYEELKFTRKISANA